jgi:methionyl-tRNA formyltransferase
MKLLLWLGNEPNQRALANKLADEFEVIGIVTESRIGSSKLTAKRILNGVIEKVFLSSINAAWFGMRNKYDLKYPKYPSVPLIDVENINCKEAHDFSSALKPDLIVVSGTRLVKSEMLSIPAASGILNLHTGISPYIKGGPNCTNWCIATNQQYLIGNTIMWIDEGIDSGNIVTTEYTELDWSKDLNDIHWRVMEHAHSLYSKAIAFISAGGKSNVPQSELGSGTTYYTKDWTLKQKFRLVRNLKITSKDYDAESSRKEIKIVSID